VTSAMDCRCDFARLAEETEGFSGADLRIMVKESFLSALMENREYITENDITRGKLVVENRNELRHMNWL